MSQPPSYPSPSPSGGGQPYGSPAPYGQGSGNPGQYGGEAPYGGQNPSDGQAHYGGQGSYGSPAPAYDSAPYGSPSPYGGPPSGGPGGPQGPGGHGGPHGPGGPRGPQGPGAPGGPQGPGGPFGGPPGRPDPSQPAAPNLFNGSTVHGVLGQKGIRHPWELPLLWVGIAIAVIAGVLWILGTIYTIFQGFDATQNQLSELGSFGGWVTQLYVFLGLLAILLWIGRAIGYAGPRATAARMSPTQFPEGYRMVAEAAQAYGLRRVPDAYVMLGNGQINAYASGHGFRRFVVVYSDLFEVGGAVRDPEALRFIIGHEVGHMAAGHVSYFRNLFSYPISQIPLLGSALSRAQEYTADNFGYTVSAPGSAGAMAVLGVGKYLNADLNVHELADRAATEKGLWLHIINWGSSHPVLTWRAYALRDRRRAGKIWFRPGSPLWPGTPANGPMFRGPLPAASVFSGTYPTPAEALRLLDEADVVRPAGITNQFGRFPGVDYAGQPTAREIQTSVPLLSRAADAPVRFGPDDGPGGHAPSGSGPVPSGGGQGSGGYGAPHGGQGSGGYGSQGGPGSGGYQGPQGG